MVQSLSQLLSDILGNARLDRGEVDKIELTVFADGKIDEDEKKRLGESLKNNPELNCEWKFDEHRFKNLAANDVTDIFSYAKREDSAWKVKTPTMLFRSPVPDTELGYQSIPADRDGLDTLHPPLDVSNFGLPAIFVGELGDESSSVLSALQRVLPPGLFEFMHISGAQIHLLPEEEMLELAGNSENVHFAFTAFDKESDLHSFVPNDAIYTLQLVPMVHEIGHVIELTLEKLAFKNNIPQFDHPTAIAQKHFEQIKDDWIALPQPLTCNNQGEWFAEAFVFYFFGKGDWGDSWLGYNPPLKYYYWSWRKRDPVGYLLMAKLEQAFLEGLDPALVFTAEGYEEAKIFVKAHPNMTDEDIALWKNLGLENSITNNIYTILEDKLLGPEEKIERLHDVTIKFPEYKFAQRILAYQIGMLLSQKPMSEIKLNFNFDLAELLDDGSKVY